MAKTVASNQPRPASFAHPVAWIRQLTRLQPAKWNWSRSTRAALGMGIPLAIGTLSGNLGVYLWVAMGFLLQMGGERDNPYHILFQRMLITTPLSLLGILLGYLSYLPWEVVILCFTVLAFISAILSSYNSALSIGTMQMLMMGTVAVGNPAINHYWHVALLAFTGIVFYAALLGLEALILRHRPEDQASENLLRALASLALHRAKKQPIEQDEQQITTNLNTLYTLMFHTRSLSQGRNLGSEHTAAVLQRFDSLFASIVGCADSTQLNAIATTLEQAATAYASKSKHIPVVNETPGCNASLNKDANELFQTLWQRSSTLPDNSITATQPAAKRKQLAAILGELSPGREVLLAAAALALCTFIAYALRWKDDYSHWYWIPMTVILVMKPDMGSVFSRSMLRSIGTSFGVIIGGVILYFVSPGPLFVIIMAALAFVLPWASQRSYAMMSLIITPLVLVLIDYVSPEKNGVNYALLRFEDTLLGGAIALVFGYLLWPKTNHRQLYQNFQQIRLALAHYLHATLPQPNTSEQQNQLHSARHAAYGQIANIRTNLQKQLSDPPPASQEALSWFPLISSAARMANSITTYSINNTGNLSTHDLQYLQKLADLIAHGTPADFPKEAWQSDTPGSAEDQLLRAAMNELQHVNGMVDIRPASTTNETTTA
ncbi:FUSC family protein [Paenalcaligenes sp. Me52]|uniref:FUSC family protein n=1 Tax=Paenalcaligenes sp. Me52 TaxID=3392038 RepID=UPI003D291CBF